MSNGMRNRAASGDFSGGGGESVISPCRSKYFAFRRDILSHYSIAG
jgi:hypothetical protein